MLCKTLYKPKVIDNDEALSLYYTLKYNIQWEEGVRSKKGFTRKAKALNVGDIPEIDKLIVKSLSSITNTNYLITSIYLNYYENENHWTPNHSHPGTHQLVISLGEERILTINKKEYKLGNGDVILFGSSTHGIPKSNVKKEGRISIATFMIPIL
jgi:hypothetical protein